MEVTRFEDLECRQETRRSLVRTVYAATRDGAFKKDLRLSGQIQAAASVMANIAEGFIRRSMALSSTKVKDDTWLQPCPCDKGC